MTIDTQIIWIYNHYRHPRLADSILISDKGIAVQLQIINKLGINRPKKISSIGSNSQKRLPQHQKIYIQKEMSHSEIILSNLRLQF